MVDRTYRIVIGADPFAAALKDEIAEHLHERGHTLIDVSLVEGEERPYYEVAAAAARTLQAGGADRGLLFCGTGMGMAVVANKFRGVVASVVESVFAAKMCRAINNANVLAMGSMIVAPFMAREMVDVWLSTEHTEGLDQFADFLRQAIQEVARIEGEATR